MLVEGLKMPVYTDTPDPNPRYFLTTPRERLFFQQYGYCP